MSGVYERESESGTIVAILRKINTRHIIAFLLAALFSLIAFVGKQYAGRLDALEGVDKSQQQDFDRYRKEQNGHLHSIDVRLERMETEQKFTRQALEKIDRKLDSR